MDDLEEFSTKMDTNQLLATQRDLKQEKDLLQKVLAKIDNQVHRLQVEQLHLLGLMNKELKGTGEESPAYESVDDNEQDETVNKSLDLSVGSALKYFQEEIEDDDDL